MECSLERPEPTTLHNYVFSSISERKEKNNQNRLSVVELELLSGSE